MLMYWSLIGSMLCDSTAVWGPAGLSKMQEAGMEGLSVNIQINTINTFNIVSDQYRQIISDLYSHLDQFVLQIFDFTASWYSIIVAHQWMNQISQCIIASLKLIKRLIVKKGLKFKKIDSTSGTTLMKYQNQKGSFCDLQREQTNMYTPVDLLQTRIEVKTSNMFLIF